MQSLTVSEIFGPTFQGEGASLGRRCGFVRLGRCNLTCTWCDTPYTWDWQGKNGKSFSLEAELSDKSVEAVVSEVVAMSVDRVVITGGEPMLQRRGLLALASALAIRGMVVEVETNGTIAPSSDLLAVVDQFNVSPKLSNSGVDYETRIKPTALALFPYSTAFKFVVRQAGCLDEVDEIVHSSGLSASQVWIMPEGTDSESIIARTASLSDAVLDRGYNLTTRLHALIWGDARMR